ncbi:MAG: hypothetical protein KDD62_11415, partial [Bdellovibrionales bacterium]|nr:hypothetical protein [Bdellovibrionales bacterium]
RNNPDLHFGASTRAALMYQKACQAWALVQGRNSVTEDDLKTLLTPALAHRLKFHAAAGNPHEALQALATPFFEKLVRSGL